MQVQLPPSGKSPAVLAVKLTVAGERSVRAQHPWIFSESIARINKEGKAGDVAVIFSHTKNKPIGVGLFDPRSPIRIKMLHFGSGVKVDEDLFLSKIAQAHRLRLPLLETDTNSYRLIYGENDGFPGFIADVYDQVLVIKLYSEIWKPYLQLISELLLAVTEAKVCVLRLSRKLLNLSSWYQLEGAVIYGNLENETVIFKEHGIRFAAHVIKGHKTGYFLDHRANRKKVGALAKNKKVLDVFSYAGGFSIHCLVGGAREVTSLDISEQAIEVASFNAQLNTFKGKHLKIIGDAFIELNRLISEGQKYDLVVIDPPSFAKTQSEIPLALKKYGQLAHLGAQLLAKEGWLVLASCSSRVSAEAFFSINENTLNKLTQGFKCIEKTYHDIDHPIHFPEGAYLKCGYYQRKA